jgi:DNA polymerase III alpha subunit
MPDIDIDFADREVALKHFKHIKAARISVDDKVSLIPHNSGIYVHSIPVNPQTNLSTIDYTTAENRGYFKLDFLNVSIYKDVRDQSHLDQLMTTDPVWDLLEQDDFVNLVFHINGHGNILREMLPRSVEQLAAVLAIIRPAKRYLVGKDWTTVMQEVWIKPTNNDYYFKKSHAISYAMAVIVHMNLICESLHNNS